VKRPRIPRLLRIEIRLLDSDQTADLTFLPFCYSVFSNGLAHFLALETENGLSSQVFILLLTPIIGSHATNCRILLYGYFFIKITVEREAGG
jgi:hypothetical protein